MFWKKKPKYDTASIYVYGNGIYAEPFWDRVNAKKQKLYAEYEVIEIIEEKFTPERYLGKNCLGMKTYKAEEFSGLYKVIPKNNI